jgi:SMC interacting uncharacterized protein involved in chromosome segregation
MNYTKSIFIILIVCSTAAYFAVLHKERGKLLSEITDLNRQLTLEKTEREKEKNEAKLEIDLQLSKNEGLTQQVASLAKDLKTIKQDRIKEQQSAKMRLDDEIKKNQELMNENKEIASIADKLKQDLDTLNQQMSKLKRDIEEGQIVEKKEVKSDKSWLHRLLN